MSDFIKKIIFFMLFLPCYGYADTYTYACWSDKQFDIKLNSTGEVIPVRGASYSILFDSDDGKYEGHCDAPEPGFFTLPVQSMYKSKYDKTYTPDTDAGDGFFKLDDNVSVKTYFTLVSLTSTKDVVVPFNDVGNGAVEKPRPLTEFSSGGKGYVIVRIKKTILEGKIIIPSFSVSLYDRWNEDGSSYDARPLVRVIFEKSVIDVKKLCNASSVSKTFENNETAKFINGNKEKKIIGNIAVSIKCEDVDLSGLKLDLFIKGNVSNINPAYFTTNNSGVDVGFLSPENKLIYEGNPYVFTMPNSSSVNLIFGVSPIINNTNQVKLEQIILSEPTLSLISE